MSSTPIATASSAKVEETVRQKARRRISLLVHCLPKTYASDRYVTRRAIRMLMESGNSRTQAGRAVVNLRSVLDLLKIRDSDHQTGTEKISNRDTHRV